MGKLWFPRTGTAVTQSTPPHSPHFVQGIYTLGVLEVVSPERSNLVLATHIPNSEAYVLVFHGLHVETLGKIKQKSYLVSNTKTANDAPLGPFLFSPVLAMSPEGKER